MTIGVGDPSGRFQPKLRNGQVLIKIAPSCLFLALAVLLCPLNSWAQTRQNFTLFGDVTVDASGVHEREPLTLDVFLYKGGNVIGRQRLGNDGRYRFMNLLAGMYEVAVEIDNVEVARVSRLIAGQFADDVRVDINLRYRATVETKKRPAVLSVADSYPRTGQTRSLYQKALRAIEEKNYPEAIASLGKLVALDANDYPAWFELGVLYFVRKEYEEAEKAFVSCISTQQSYVPAVLNLGRVKLARKNYQGAVDALDKALQIDPQNAQAHYFLGESYLQLKKGSVAVGHFNQALKLDPVGMADAHLRLASLYNVAGYKNLAAEEYEEFLKKKPNYGNRKKLEDYITTHKSKTTRATP